MMKKTLITALVVLLLLAAVPASALAASEHVKPYRGMIGSDSPLYGMKLFVQQVDESLAGSNSAKLQKQMDHANERLSEAAAAAETNNTVALEAALDQYGKEITDIITTMEDDGVGEEQYSEMGPEIETHEQALTDMINNSSLSEDSVIALIGAYNNSTQIKNGRPFVFINNTTYFVPPGHLKNGKNMTFVPPGLAKKGYVGLDPAIINGSPAKTIKMDKPGNGKNKTVEYVNATSQASGKDKIKGNGNGNGNGNGKK